MISDFSFKEILVTIKSRESPEVQLALDKTHLLIHSYKLQNQKQKIQDDQFLPEY